MTPNLTALVSTLCLYLLVSRPAAAGTIPEQTVPDTIVCAGKLVHHWAEEQNSHLPADIRSAMEHPSEAKANLSSRLFGDHTYSAIPTRPKSLSHIHLYPVPPSIRLGYQMSVTMTLQGISQAYSSDRNLLFAEYDGHSHHRFCRCVVLYLWNPRGYRKVLQSESDFEGRASLVPFRIGRRSPIFVSTYSMTGPHHASCQIYKVEDNDTVLKTLDFDGDDATLEYKDLNGDGLSEVIADSTKKDGYPITLEKELDACSNHRFDWHQAFHVVSQTVYRWADGQFKNVGTYYQVTDEKP